VIGLYFAAALTCTSPGVIDGDTLRCGDGTRVRLWGVNSPERHEPAGPAATRALAEIIRAQPLYCTPKGQSYERVVARCFTAKGSDVAREMVKRGHAVDWPKFSKGFYAR
jgi:endonuclease YncB( thermonuclease family)